MKRVLLAGLLAGLASFFWGFLYWTVLPFGMQTIKPVPEGAALIEKLQAAGVADGTYHFPSEEEMHKPESEGKPRIAMLTYHPAGVGGMGATIGKGFGLAVLLGLLLASFYSCCGARRGGSLLCRAGFIIMIGVIAAFATRIMDWNWFKFTFDYTLLRLGDEFVGMIFMAFIIAAIVKPCDHPKCQPATAA